MHVHGTYELFSDRHPLVPLACLVPTLLMAMLVLQPVYVGISLGGGLLLASLVLGPSAILARLRWQLPFLALIVLLNPIFVRTGSTVLLELGPLSPTLESLSYGLCMGGMLLSTLLWFECCARIVDGDRLREVWGGRLPSLVLVVSMVFQLLPRLLRRAELTEGVLASCTAAEGEGASAGDATGHGGGERFGTTRWNLPVRRRIRSLGIVLSWALEDSLERADSMRARGWAASPRRSHYRRIILRPSDVAAITALVLLGLLNAPLASVALAQWRFYPQMPTLVAWWGYLPFALQVLVPSLALLAERLSWRGR